MGHEFEFFLLDPETHEPLFGGVHIFNVVRNQYVPFLDTLLDDLQAVGIDVITHNCEYAPSQFEINLGPGLGLAGADKAFTFKNAIKELAHRAGYLATFISKPAADTAGCGCHVHISLIDRRTGKSAFLGDGVPETLGFSASRREPRSGPRSMALRGGRVLRKAATDARRRAGPPGSR